MNIPIDTVNAAMNLTGGVLALLAAIIAAVVAMLPSESKAAVAAQIRAKTLSIVIILTAVAASVFLAVFDMARVSLIFMAIYGLLVSINYLRGALPATRTETLTLIIQLIITASWFFMYMLSRIVTVIEKFGA